LTSPASADSSNPLRAQRRLEFRRAVKAEVSSVVQEHLPQCAPFLNLVCIAWALVPPVVMIARILWIGLAAGPSIMHGSRIHDPVGAAFLFCDLLVL